MTRVMTVVNKVKAYWAAHPDSDDVKACMKATGASRNTAKKYKPKTAEEAPAKPVQEAPAAGNDFQATYPRHGDSHRDTSQQEKKAATVTPEEAAQGDTSHADNERHGDTPKREFWRLRL